MTPEEARALFEIELTRPGGADVLRAALAIAAEDDPSVDIDRYVARVDAFGGIGRSAVAANATHEELYERLNELLYLDLGFDGTRCDFEAPESSYMSRVLDRRTGLPIAMAIVWVEVGRRLGLDCAGVNFPSHFLARVEINGRTRIVDPFNGGRELSREELGRRIARHASGTEFDPRILDPAPAKEILARMLRNLKALYMRKGDPARAYNAVDWLLTATPDAADELRDRGVLGAMLGATARTRADFERYLELRPDGDEADAIRNQLRLMKGRPTLLN